jgi:putative ABC transport system substrate-binding protein
MNNRRKLVIALGAGAFVSPFAARAQQPAMPVVGYLSGRSPSDSAHIIAAFRQGLKEAGFVEGQNVAIESRFAEGHFDRLPDLAAELVRRQVNVLVATGGTIAVVKAKPVVPATMPVVFAMGGDPVKLGVVASLARPGGNITGVTFLVNELAAKSIGLLHELVPKASTLGFLLNPNDPNAESDMRGAQNAADTLKLKLVFAKAGTEAEMEPAFASLVRQKVGALFVATDPFFTIHRSAIVALAARHALPAIYQLREFATDGGLMIYGTSIADANRQLGVYAGRVLKGTKPADLPVMQSMRFELIINRKTAQALKITIPQSLMVQATEFVE